MTAARYKKPHIYFLQAIMNRGIISKTECHKLCRKFYELEDKTFDEDISGFLDLINLQIHSFHFKVKQTKREDNGKTVFVLVSLAENDLNRLTIGGDFSKQEMDIFKKILELIIYSDEGDQAGKASSIDILNLADNVSPKVSKTEIKRILERFVNEQWFYENNGMIIMSPRTILELEVYIADVFSGFVHTCKMCHMVVFYGKSCSACSARMHIFCAERYFSNAGTDKCLACGNTWNGDDDSIRAQVNGANSSNNASQPVHTSRKRRKVVVNN